MTDAQNPIPFEAYQRLRDEQSSRTFANQLHAFSSKVLGPPRRARPGAAGDPPAPIRPITRFLDRPLGISAQNVFFDRGPPYTSGQPHPESAIKTGGTAEGAYFNIESLGDPVTGHLSVGVSAGIVRGADWTGGTYTSNLPDRWLLGDCIKSVASIFQIVDLPKGLQPGTALSVNAELSWDTGYPSATVASSDPFWFKHLYRDALFNTPGLANSAMGGFVGCTAMAEIDVWQLSENAVLSSSQSFHEILNLGINAKNYGDTVQDQAAAPYLFFDFAFADNPWVPVNLLASVGFVPGAKQLMVETTIRLAGLRGGINDPNGGWVTAAFMNIYKGASPVSFVPGRPNPFLVNRITAFSTS